MRLYISRTILEEMRERSLCQFTLWTNTSKDDLYAQCIRIVSLKLCIEDITDAGYWKYMNATAFERAQMEQKCLMLYPSVFFEFWASHTRWLTRPVCILSSQIKEVHCKITVKSYWLGKRAKTTWNKCCKEKSENECVCLKREKQLQSILKNVQFITNKKSTGKRGDLLWPRKNVHSSTTTKSRKNNTKMAF